MNLWPGTVDWRAEDRQTRLLPGYVPATEVFRIVQQQQLLPEVSGYDFEDDARLAEEIAESVLWVGKDPNVHDLVHLEPAPPYAGAPTDLA